MVVDPVRMAIFLCLCLSLVSVGSVSLNSSVSDHESQWQMHGQSQHESPRTESELQVPAALQSFLQDDDSAFWHTAEELRVPHALRQFLQQSDVPTSVSKSPSRPMASNPVYGHRAVLGQPHD